MRMPYNIPFHGSAAWVCERMIRILRTRHRLAYVVGHQKATPRTIHRFMPAFAITGTYDPDAAGPEGVKTPRAARFPQCQSRSGTFVPSSVAALSLRSVFASISVLWIQPLLSTH